MYSGSCVSGFGVVGDVGEAVGIHSKADLNDTSDIAV